MRGYDEKGRQRMKRLIQFLFLTLIVVSFWGIAYAACPSDPAIQVDATKGVSLIQIYRLDEFGEPKKPIWMYTFPSITNCFVYQEYYFLAVPEVDQVFIKWEVNNGLVLDDEFSNPALIYLEGRPPDVVKLKAIFESKVCDPIIIEPDCPECFDPDDCFKKEDCPAGPGCNSCCPEPEECFDPDNCFKEEDCPEPIVNVEGDLIEGDNVETDEEESWSPCFIGIMK